MTTAEAISRPVTVRPSEPLTLTIEGAAELLHCSTFTIRRRIRDKSIPSVKLGGKILIPYARLREVLNNELVK